MGKQSLLSNGLVPAPMQIRKAALSADDGAVKDTGLRDMSMRCNVGIFRPSPECPGGHKAFLLAKVLQHTWKSAHHGSHAWLRTTKFFHRRTARLSGKQMRPAVDGQPTAVAGWSVLLSLRCVSPFQGLLWNPALLRRSSACPKPGFASLLRFCTPQFCLIGATFLGASTS